VELYVVAADLNSCQKVVFGANPADSILEGKLASAALPPRTQPIQKENRYLMDGAFVSNLLIETALQMAQMPSFPWTCWTPCGPHWKLKRQNLLWAR
jgi:predicted acylesterase/phospholipase RssA